MKQTKGAIGNLINRYRAVLKKCHLLNTFGSLAVAGMLVMGGASYANALEIDGDHTVSETLSSLEDVSATGNISASAGDVYYDIQMGSGTTSGDITDVTNITDAANITAGGAIIGGDIVIYGNLTAEHVEAYANSDPTLKDSSGNPGTLEIHGTVNMPGDNITKRRFDLVNTVGSHNEIGNVSTGACITLFGNGTEKSTLNGGTLDIGGQGGGGSFSVGYGMQATIDKIIFEIDTRSARIHGGNPNAATILDVNTFVLNQSSLYAESYWDYKPAVAAIRYLSDDTQQGVINGNGDIGVGANAMLGLGEGATLIADINKRDSEGVLIDGQTIGNLINSGSGDIGGNFTKKGEGDLQLTGDNSGLTGTTTVEEGRLTFIDKEEVINLLIG